MWLAVMYTEHSTSMLAMWLMFRYRQHRLNTAVNVASSYVHRVYSIHVGNVAHVLGHLASIRVVIVARVQVRRHTSKKLLT